MQSEWVAVGDAELVFALREGDAGAFAALVERHERGLLSFFFRMGSDRPTAEDCVQEVFLRLYRHAAGYVARAKFTTFLYRVARNLWIDRVRAQAARGGKSLSLEAGPVGDGVAAPAPNPVEILERQEAESALKRAIARLPNEQRAVLEMSEMQGLKYQEIAEILSIPIGTVKSRMHTAVEKLKASMAG